MRRLRTREFLFNDGASSAVEFVAIFPFFLIITFFALEIAIALFWWQTCQEAAQLGARLAVVSDPVVTLATCTDQTNCKAAGGNYGGRCSASNCTGYATVTCTGGTSTGCNATAFTAIYNRMHNLFTPIQASNVSITYAYSGLGFAGGRIIPNVTVTISGVPFHTGIVPILGNLIAPGTGELTTVPAMTVTMTGEDLNSTQSSS